MGKKKLVLLLLVICIFLTPLFYYFVSYLTIKVPNTDISRFKNKLIEVMKQPEPFEMNEITDFEWDRMYVFYPYTSRDKMVSVVGRKWTRGPFIGYLFEQSVLGQYPLDDESLNKLVFTQNGKVVLDVTLDRREADFTNIPEVVANKNSKFIVRQANVLDQYIE